MKIALLDMNVVFEKSRRGRVLTQKLQGNGKQWQEQLQRIEEKVKKLDAQAAALRPAERPADSLQAQNLERERRGLEMELSYTRQRGDNDIKAQVQHSQTQIMEEFGPMLREYATQNDIDLILTVPGTPILYANEALDITPAAIAYYDARVKL